MADIELLKRLAEAATPGPWSVGDANRDERDIGIHGAGEGSIVADVCVDVWGDPDANADFIAAANPAAILALIAENERLREVLAEKLIDSTMLTGIDIGNGSLTIGAKGGVCGIMADSFGQMLFESGAENYIEAFFSSSKHPELGQIVVTVKRETGKTPHQLRQVAEAERDQLKAELERVRADVNFFHQQCRREKLTCMQLQAELERARAEGEALRKHLAECADSLESEVLDRYGSSKDHPAMRSKFERDMQDVIDARAAMGKGTGEHSAENQAETRANAGVELASKGGRAHG